MQEDEGLRAVIGARTNTMRQCSLLIFMMEALEPESDPDGQLALEYSSCHCRVCRPRSV
jgi:hypothetical protein